MMSSAVKGKTIAEVEELTRSFKGMMSIHEQSLDGDGEEETEVIAATDEPGAKLGDLEALRGVVKFPVRIKCATLSWNTLAQPIQETSTPEPCPAPRPNLRTPTSKPPTPPPHHT